MTPPRTYEEACEQADARAAHVAALHGAAAAGERVVVCGHCGGDGCERCHGVGEVVAVRDEAAVVRRVA